MQSTIFFMLAIVAFTAAKQLNPGPQAISESSSTSKANDKRFATQEITLFLTPSQIKSLNEARNSANNEAEAQSFKDNQQYTLQGYGQQPEQTPWPKYTRVAPVEQPQEESQGFISQNPFLYKSRPVIENQDGGFDPFNLYREQKLREQQSQIIEQEQERKEAQLFRPYSPVSDQVQEEALLHDELQQHWGRLLEHNRGQLKALSEANEKQNSEDLKANKESSQEEEARSQIEKEIQLALRNNKPYDFRQENSRAEDQGNNQRSPILIHKEVRVTKHLPVRVVQKVKVSMPTPVLVPVPEPYEVEIPHPYPVPYQIIKHIPVPVIRKH